MEEPINLTLINGTAYVFNPKDYMKLRRKHRILGTLVGTCSYRSAGLDERSKLMKYIFYSFWLLTMTSLLKALPCELMPWETAVLIEHNIARLVSKAKTLAENPTNEQIRAYQNEMSTLLAEQAEMMKLERLQDTQRNMRKILIGKKRKHTSDSEQANELDVLQRVEKNFVFDEKYALIETQLAHSSEHAAFICKWPKDRSLICCVFRDCWLRGFHVMSGESFGADLLLYPGDPLVYHASHIIILVDKLHISALELVCKARVSVAVNKICILAYFDNDTGCDADDWPTVGYQTVLRDTALTYDQELTADDTS